MPPTAVRLPVLNAPPPPARPAAEPAREQTPREREYAGWLESLRGSPYMDYPMMVGLETLARCNAACVFCPYPTMTRVGDRMPDALIEKIVRDLKDVPNTVKYSINLTRVNEPFLDKRIVDVMRLINAELPAAGITIYTNGSAFTDKLLDRLQAVERLAIFNVSLNAHTPGEYKRIMSLDFDRTVRNIDMLHERVADGRLAFPISVSRVADGSPDDDAFARFVGERWPRAQVVLPKRIDWIGTVALPQVEPVPQAPCAQWFVLQILADGRNALCAIDHDGRHGLGHAAERHVLELYNHPVRRRLRAELLDRREHPPCAGCAYWG